jgi:elongation factor G
MDCSRLRNIGVIAHIDAGKTTFSERVLFYSERIHRMGEVHEGAATMDFMPEERERGITIGAACVTCAWQGHSINLVDTPGHVDFTVEVERCLRVLDAAVGVFCAVGGVEPQSETVWRQADAFGIPRLAVVNKMDRPGASFAAVLESMRRRLRARPVAVTVPLGEGGDFRAVLDLVRRRRLIFDGASKGKIVESAPFGAEDEENAAPWREALMDALTMEDDALLARVLSGEEPAPEELDAALRLGTLRRSFVPVFAVSALRNIGVQPVLDAVCRYLPAPSDMPPVPLAPLAGASGPDGGPGVVRSDPDAPVCALVFKVLMEGGRKIAFLRLYAGTLREGDGLLNAARGGRERVMRLYRLRADQREQLEAARAGDIVAVQGLKEAETGDTLLGEGAPPALLEPIRLWRPVISLAFEPKNAEEGERLDAALRNFRCEDPSLRVETDEAALQRVVSGMGELQLEVLADRMRREYGISPRLGNPGVVCRETVLGAAEATGEFDRELGGQAHYGLARVRVSPRGRGLGVTAGVAPQSGAPEWPASLLEAALAGARDACVSGPLGQEVDDVDIVVLELRRKQGLASVPGVHMAARHGARLALEKAKSLLLEPVMRLELTVPEDFLGAVIALCGARGARIEGLSERGGLKQLTALGPMRGLFGFATSLRSASQGRAGLMMRFELFDALSK